MYGNIHQWLEERIHLSKITNVITSKTIPVHRHTIWYYLGGMTLFLFVVQIVTGIFLLFYYKPTAEEAFESIQFIMAEVHFGWLIHSIHSWASNLLIFVLFVHLVSVFFLRAYRRPREITWISGCILFFIAIGFGFTGYLLPWNELSFFATAVGTDIPGSFPIIGDHILVLLRGGEMITGATLNRFFAIHVWVLPAFLLIFLMLHLYLVQTHGMSIPLSEKAKTKKAMKFYPNFLLRDIVGWLVAIGLLAVLAALFPWELGEKADPLSPAPEGIKPEWYFLFMFQVLKIIPSTIGPFEGDMIGVVLFTVGAILLILVPFFDRRANRGEPNRSLMAIGIVVLLVIVGMTIWGVFD